MSICGLRGTPAGRLVRIAIALREVLQAADLAPEHAVLASRGILDRAAILARGAYLAGPFERTGLEHDVGTDSDRVGAVLGRGARVRLDAGIHACVADLSTSGGSRSASVALIGYMCGVVASTR